ncbi:MAG: response regulator [Flavisolibacter sp.]
MNKFIKKLPLPAKLVLIGILPLLVLVVTSFQMYREKNDKITMIEGYLQRTRQSAKISVLVNELQRERRYSFGNVLKKEWFTEMRLQRASTDSALEVLQEDPDPRLKGFEQYTFLDELPDLRNKIDDRTLSADAVLNFYTNVIFRLNTLNNVAAGSVVYLQSANDDLLAQKLLQEMITYLGIIRANIYFALNGNEAAASPAALNSIYKIYRSYHDEFLIKASPEAVEKFRAAASSTEVKEVLSYVQGLTVSDSSLNKYDPEDWWTMSAIGINKLQSLQQQLLRTAEQMVSKIYDNEITARNITLLVLVLLIILVIALTAYIARIIAGMMAELKNAAERIAVGATNIDIDIHSNDAIGSLARSIQQIDRSNRELTKAAESIGQGNFNVVITPRSDEDILSNAVKKMKRELRTYRQENEGKLWMHAGLEKVNNAMQGEKELEDLASDTLHALLEYIDAELGLFYLTDDHTLTYAAGYAVANDATIPKKLSFGETLVGEAALQQATREVDVPEDFLKITSGTGNALPRHIMVLPLTHNHVVEGVIEIASFKPFEPAVRSLLQEMSNTAALILRTAKNRSRLQELLEETQSQSEELQAQHAELENINTELEAQAQKLQVSEEELKVQQEELMQANQELEERSRLLEERNQMIAQQNQEIRRKAEELALSTKYKSEFLANMTHELRTPLNSILLLSRLLSENNEKNLSGDQVEYAKVIMSSGQGLLSLIDEILDLSKIEAGKMTLEFANVPINDMAGELKGLFQPIAKEKNVSFDVNIDPALPPTMETDRQRLEQVLKNLVSNALKFTSKGGVTLSIRHLPDQDQFIAFTVKDTGIGIAQEKQKLIFEAFQQADGSTRRKYGGTGLGLSISRELVKLLGGEIRLESEPGKGSEFTVYIPRKKTAVPVEVKTAEKEIEEILETPVIEEVEAHVNEKQKERDRFINPNIPESIPDDRKEITPTDRTILIIEDDVAFARSLLDFTRSKGYKGLVAVRGDEGIELAMHYKPVGILLDLELPVKDGWEVMEELKKNKETRHIPVHMMSSYEVKKESIYKGAVDFINKPVAFEKMQEIFQKIEKVVSQDKKKVLIVEENTKHAKALAYYLQTFDINAEISNDYAKGVESLKKEDVNCVIMDMGIPGEQGYEMLEAVKKEAGMENLPIIIFTGKSLSRAEESRIRQYADTIVVKTAHSYKRILDEVSLFLHLMEEERTREKNRSNLRTLGKLEEVLSGKKVMVVDDDVRNIFSLTRALETHSMTVISATDGREALDQLEQNSDVDAVLMDIMMPEMDGYETMKRIRKMKKFKHLPIIAVTAKAMTGDREKCIQAGASDYISKPVDVDQLLSLLRVWLYDKGV